VCFTRYERATRRPIGAANLHTIDHARRTATFTIIIGQPECRGKGYGAEAARLMIASASHHHFLRLLMWRPCSRP
jgi:RimJ/RimL family protein N-acetyltransferase